ncbi:ESX secretion-associated protein EspG [Longimycelium tulufanense]|uniref:ESX secretion-associated protein EspG n=1 Tax=Longimycelium tulufanense TaxID=907463 RepID=A0A8J3CAN0_9PSEU|nr:ESX secretion-associated protein EspG [Longimycelium tulufanense]GGM65977.1 ESX secretion-associated protein EspG [Longimycelium tulufanense]
MIDLLGTSVDDAPITLTTLEFDVLWEHLELGPMPLVVKVASPGRTWTERAEIADTAWAGLLARGLGGPARLDPRIPELLRVLARPDRDVDARIWLNRSVRVLAAARGDEAVLAVLDGDQLTLRPVTPSGLPRAAVGVLPPCGPGFGHSVSVPSANLDAAAAACDGTPDGFARALRERGVRAEDARALAAMVAEAGNRGQFGAAARDRLDRRRRTEWVVGFFDTPRGRYLQIRRSLSGCGAWSTVCPTDQRRLTALVEEALGEAEGDGSVPNPTGTVT